MTANKKSTRRVWRDPEDAPDLSRRRWKDRFEAADVLAGKKVLRRGRPPLDQPKTSTTIRLDPEVLTHFRKSGRGWQTRVNAALRKIAGL